MINLLRKVRWVGGAPVVALCASVTLGCGGGGGGSSAPATSGGGGGGGGGTVTHEAMGGLWEGITSNDQTGTSQQFIGISTDDGRFRFLSLDTLGHFTGNMTVDGSQVDGSGIGYAAIGTTWLNNSVYIDVAVQGTISERSSFSGNWSADTGETGGFDFTYDDLYERDSSLSLIADVWEGRDSLGNPTATITIDSAGRVDAQDVSGCLYSGSVSILNPSFNVYNVELAVTNCGVGDGNYEGLAFVADTNAQNDTFIYAIDKGDLSFISAIYR